MACTQAAHIPFYGTLVKLNERIDQITFILCLQFITIIFLKTGAKVALITDIRKKAII